MCRARYRALVPEPTDDPDQLAADGDQIIGPLSDDPQPIVLPEDGEAAE